jgi:hypothetical protein
LNNGTQTQHEIPQQYMYGYYQPAPYYMHNQMPNYNIYNQGYPHQPTSQQQANQGYPHQPTSQQQAAYMNKPTFFANPGKESSSFDGDGYGSAGNVNPGGGYNSEVPMSGASGHNGPGGYYPDKKTYANQNVPMHMQMNSNNTPQVPNTSAAPTSHFTDKHLKVYYFNFSNDKVVTNQIIHMDMVILVSPNKDIQHMDSKEVSIGVEETNSFFWKEVCSTVRYEK